LRKITNVVWSKEKLVFSYYFRDYKKLVSKMVDANKEIRRAVDTGKVAFGFKQCQKELAKGNGELIIISTNMNPSEKEKLKYIAEIGEKAIFDYDKTGLVLGSVCGKPFVVSAMIVLDKGKSKVTELVVK
jgi:large subunit ribosomal protein L30e